MIDFGKTVPVPDATHIDHKSPWEVGNHEDGYLIGVEVKTIFGGNPNYRLVQNSNGLSMVTLVYGKYISCLLMSSGIK